ncbi:hypothetical protein [Dysosmobacter sp.]
MDQKMLQGVTEKTSALMRTPSCCGEAKAAARAWLNAVGTKREAAQTMAYLETLEGGAQPSGCDLKKVGANDMTFAPTCKRRLKTIFFR